MNGPKISPHMGRNDNGVGSQGILLQVHIDGLLDQSTVETRIVRPKGSNLLHEGISFSVVWSNQEEAHDMQGNARSPQTIKCSLE